ncbi:unnamed protein product, partial [Prorocentrum cordatum]
GGLLRPRRPDLASIDPTSRRRSRRREPIRPRGAPRPRPAYASIADACERRGLTSGYSHLADHSRFRYLISTDGSTIDDTRVYWMLSTGSLVFKQITPLLPYGVPGLEPWVHFVPVREDLGDLVAKVRWARQNDPACRGMAEG